MNSKRYSCQILMKLEFTRQIFGKYSNITYHETPSSWSGVFPCGQTYRWTDVETDMAKPTVAFRNFAKAPKLNGAKLHSPVCRHGLYKHNPTAKFPVHFLFCILCFDGTHV
jgi:hypothetical protein